MRRIKIELDGNEVGELFKALALRIEQVDTESYLGKVAQFYLEKVAQKIMDAAKENKQDWPDVDENLLSRLRYPIKRVTVSLYETNPKPKPGEEGSHSFGNGLYPK